MTAQTKLVQAVRVLDVVAIGPAMVWGARVGRSMPMPVRLFLGVSGVSTILFNAYRLFRVAQGEPCGTDPPMGCDTCEGTGCCCGGL